MKILVLAGGYSPEHDVSLSSGSLIANALIENNHQVLLLDVYKNLDDNFCFEEHAISKEQHILYQHSIPSKEPDMAELWKKSNNGNAFIGKNVLSICRQADLVFLALHGGIGEDGRLQAVFECYGIPYTGSSYTGCLLAMNKNISKKLMVQNNILTAPWACYSPQDYLSFLERASTIQPPCVIKPSSCGSSIGISIVQNRSELNDAYKKASIYEDTLIIEKYIIGREFSVGILDGKALPVIEIFPKEGFYDYKNKYQTSLTTEICPAPLSRNLTRKIQKIAQKIHSILQLGYYSRIDFIMDKRENLYCLEANTLPGMTPTSLFPQQAKQIGICYSQLCELIVTHPQRPFLTLF